MAASSLDQPYDVIVVGGGLAGQVAALTAAHGSRRVLLIEKLDRCGGSTALSGGFFAFAGSVEQADRGISDSAELLLADLEKSAGDGANNALLSTYVRDQLEVYRWLKDIGATFPVIELSAAQSAPRSHLTDIRRLLQLLELQVTDSPFIDRQTGCRATELIVDAERAVCGLKAIAGQTEHTLSAGAVILASGGFSRSASLLRTFAPKQAKAILHGGLGNTGDGLLMAWRLGAGMADMGFINSTFGSHPETTDQEHELLCAYYLGAIVVNQRGRRFVNESKSYKLIGEACLEQPGAIGYQIFDSVVRDRSERGVPLNDIDTLQDRGHVLCADTLSKLAHLINVPAEQLTMSVNRYNESVRSNVEDEFGRASLCNGLGERVTVEVAPFYAYPSRPLMFDHLLRSHRRRNGRRAGR